jgi:phosphatidylserine decarboxylase
MPVNSVQSLLLDVICWDKDRFGKDYMGEFDLALEDIFANGQTAQEATWYPLRSKRPGKKTSVVSGEVLLQFTLFDNNNPGSTAHQVFDKFNALVKSVPEGTSRTATPSMTPLQASSRSPNLAPVRAEDGAEDEDEDDFELDDEVGEEPGGEPEDLSKPEAIERRKRRLRVKSLRKKRKMNPYEFINGGSDVVGIIFLEIDKIKDLPPESNFTKTSFDMDPFVVASLGRKTYRTRRIRHNLNPVFNEKMVFQVLSQEQTYSFSFTVIDHDKYSGNDFIASCDLPVKGLIEKAPSADPQTGLYDLREVPEYGSNGNGQKKKGFRKLAISRSSSTQSLSKLIRPSVSKNPSSASSASAAPTVTESSQAPQGVNPSLAPPSDVIAAASAETTEAAAEGDDPDFHDYSIPLKMKNLEKWEAKHNPMLYLRAKYMPYPALRQQFWRAMLRQYDTDETGRISKVELTTMLDTLGSTLRESTIDSFFQRFPHKINGSDEQDMTVDEVVICLEDQLEAKTKPQTLVDRVKGMMPDAEKVKSVLNVPGQSGGTDSESQTTDGGSTTASASERPSQITLPSQTSASTIAVPELNTPGEEGEFLRDELVEDNKGEEHVVLIRECPICHQPRLNKRKDADIITHIATCASQDWRQVNTLMMAGFVTASQAQRKWYSKVITKISYGGYKLGANSANILVQDRITGQINEEKMSVYVRLGIRLLYKGLKSNSMEKKRSEYPSTVICLW